jgi:hypothetical protein
MKRENPGIHPLLHLKKTPHSSNTLIFGPYLPQEGQQIFFGERGGTLPHLDTLYSFNEVLYISLYSFDSLVFYKHFANWS